MDAWSRGNETLVIYVRKSKRMFELEPIKLAIH